MQTFEIEIEDGVPNMERDEAAPVTQRRNRDLNEIERSWLLRPSVDLKKRKGNIDLGCVVCSQRGLKWTLVSILIAFVVVGVPILLSKSVPKHKHTPSPPDNYTIALHKALVFFNAKKSGKLPNDNGIEWRGDSGLLDGSNVEGGLVGGYYDAGGSTKFHFPMAFSMTMMSWSVIEYGHKYKEIGEYEHVRELIRWGNDYLLRTFNSSATTIDSIYSQVGGSQNGSATLDDQLCWMRPEDMNHTRPALVASSAPELAAEIAASMAAASIVFLDDASYSKKLSRGARTVFEFARDKGKTSSYSLDNPSIEPFYNSSGYFDEHMWGAAWLFYATGDGKYLSLATDEELPEKARAFQRIPELRVLSWDNKLPAAMLLLTRMRLFLSPGYPYEEMLRGYHDATSLTMCSYLHNYTVFNWTRGGLIELSHGGEHDLEYVANAAFLASVFADYLNATGVPGWYCGNDFFMSSVLKEFATSQMKYILGGNPMNMSYVVGYGTRFPKQVHHRGASIPINMSVSCTEGFTWLDATTPNPNNVTGAMVGGPDRLDKFKDVRRLYDYTEPTLAANTGLVAALVSITSSGGVGVDKNTIFSYVPPMYPDSPPLPPPWEP